MWMLFVFLLLVTLFVLIASLQLAQGEKIGGNVKK